ncbi:hypothetical protein AMJ47_02645 [Parcubacteria bacterium DG_72]|nr:MAG: hypothetical protein AMJ47_02645 [Parcubacteria bacterium DG_72]
MTKKTRNIIFLLLVLFFLVMAPIIVIYSLGWRFDWETKKLIQPGMFYFKAWPRNCQIYINNELKKKTDIFFGSVLIENLMPANYEVRVIKEGYHPWEKNLAITKREVTEAKNITLIPQNPGPTLVSNNIEKFFFSPNKELILVKEANPAAGKEQEWSLKIIETKQNIKSHLISQEDLKIGALDLLGKLEEIELVDLTFSEDSKKVILTLGAKERLYYFILDINTANIIPIDFLKINPEKLFFHTQDQNKILILSDSELREVDIAQKQTTEPLIKGIVYLYIDKRDIYYLTKEGFIFKTSNLGQNQERINIMPLEIKQESKYELQTLNNNIFLKEDSSLYLFLYDNMSFEKLIDPSTAVKVSGDSKKIAYFNNHEIWVMFLEKKYEQPQKEPKDKVFINRFSENIKDLFWYTDHYLIFSLEDKIKVAEIDERDKINIVDLAEFKEPQIFFANKKLYLLSENNLYASPELTP